MPIYDYRCLDAACRHTEMVILPNSDAISPRACEKCGASMARVFPVPGRIRMGTGTTRRDSGKTLTEV